MTARVKAKYPGELGWRIARRASGRIDRSMGLGRGHATIDMRILLVDDYEPMRELKKILLRRMGTVVVEAQSGRDALKIWRRSRSIWRSWTLTCRTCPQWI